MDKGKKGHPDEKLLLLKKGKRGILNIIFGRTTLIICMMILQILLLFMAFSSLSAFMPYIYSVMTLFNGIIIFHLVNQPANPAIKISWILLLVISPPVGIVLYLFVELDLGHRMINARLETLIGETRRYVPDKEPLRQVLREEAPELYSLSGYTRDNGNFPVYNNTKVKYLPSGESSMDEIVRQLKRAKKFIFLEFFIIEEGQMWGRVLRILEEKVRQGVEVRVMYDGTCALFRVPYRYPKMLEGLGIKCKMFSPIRPLMSSHYNHRDHRKILVVDGRTAFTGGVNLADEYINERKLYGHWKDVSIMFKGDAVRSFTLMFLQMWNITETSENYQKYLHTDMSIPDAPGYVLPYGDSPLDDEHVGEMIYMDIINRAQRYVHIMTPYLILDNEMITALCFAAKRGVEVSIILPHIPDKKYAFVLAKTHYHQLISAGVHILEYTPGFVHAKVFVSDDIKAVVGTINLDYRSLYHHFECAAYVYDMPVVHDIEQDFLKTAVQCQSIQLEDVKKQKLMTRAAGWFLKVLAPLM